MKVKFISATTHVFTYGKEYELGKFFVEYRDKILHFNTQ